MQLSNIPTADVNNRPRPWSQEKGELDILQSSSFDRAKHAAPSSSQEGARTLGLRFHHRETESRTSPEFLFDAVGEMGNLDDEDEFGDFEAGIIVPQPEISILPLKSNFDSDLDRDQDGREPQRSKQDSVTLSLVETPDLSGLRERHFPKEALISAKSTSKDAEPRTSTTTVTASATYLNSDRPPGSMKSADDGLIEEGWGEFEDAAEKVSETRKSLSHITNELLFPFHSSKSVSSMPASAAAAPNIVDPRVIDTSAHSIYTSSTSKAKSPLETPGALSSSEANLMPPPRTAAAPSNIPPPSVLLSLLTNIIQRHYNLISSSKEPATPNSLNSGFISNIQQLATTAAHIISGRKLRWKRDMLLAQNMRIGPAHSGKAGGMKLTGVDKAEILREDGEVIDLLRTWKDGLGRIRSAVGYTTSISASIPTLNEMMPVKTTKGALTSTKGCALCGLKREERVDKVDELVEDSFGEWWIEHWGHTTCKWFWDRYHGELRQR